MQTVDTPLGSPWMTFDNSHFTIGAGSAVMPTTAADGDFVAAGFVTDSNGQDNFIALTGLTMGQAYEIKFSAAGANWLSGTTNGAATALAAVITNSPPSIFTAGYGFNSVTGLPGLPTPLIDSGDPLNPTWTEYSITFTADANTTHFVFAGDQDPVSTGEVLGYYVDDITINLVPEPTSTSLFALGVLSLIWRRSRGH